MSFKNNHLDIKTPEIFLTIFQIIFTQGRENRKGNQTKAEGFYKIQMNKQIWHIIIFLPNQKCRFSAKKPKGHLLLMTLLQMKAHDHHPSGFTGEKMPIKKNQMLTWWRWKIREQRWWQTIDRLVTTTIKTFICLVKFLLVFVCYSEIMEPLFSAEFSKVSIKVSILILG